MCGTNPAFYFPRVLWSNVINTSGAEVERLSQGQLRPELLQVRPSAYTSNAIRMKSRGASRLRRCCFIFFYLYSTESCFPTAVFQSSVSRRFSLKYVTFQNQPPKMAALVTRNKRLTNHWVTSWRIQSMVWSGRVGLCCPASSHKGSIGFGFGDFRGQVKALGSMSYTLTSCLLWLLEHIFLLQGGVAMGTCTW